MKVLLIILLFSFCLSLTGQQSMTVTIKGETTLESVLPQEMMFAFKEYKDAEIHLKNGTVTTTRININLFTGDVFFMNSSNQVMVLGNPEDIRQIIINEKIWIPVDGAFGEIFHTKDTFSMARVKRTKCSDVRKEAGFGGTTSTGSVKSVTSFSQDNTTHVALSVGEYDFETTVSYIISTGSRIFNADTRGFKKVFPDCKKEIDLYLKENKVSFNDENDLISFLQACLMIEHKN
jgi:hypothetical protein